MFAIGFVITDPDGSHQLWGIADKPVILRSVPPVRQASTAPGGFDEVFVAEETFFGGEGSASGSGVSLDARWGMYFRIDPPTIIPIPLAPTDPNSNLT